MTGYIDPDVTVRLARLADAEPIRRIYNHEVENSTVTFDLVPRSLEEQQDWAREHGARPPTNADFVGERPAPDAPETASPPITE